MGVLLWTCFLQLTALGDTWGPMVSKGWASHDFVSVTALDLKLLPVGLAKALPPKIDGIGGYMGPMVLKGWPSHDFVSVTTLVVKLLPVGPAKGLPPKMVKESMTRTQMCVQMICKQAKQVESVVESAALQTFFQNVRKIIDDEVERVRGFPVDSIAPCMERLKILGGLTNLDDIQLSDPERKLMNAYNEKPVLSRPQYKFYLGENYFEIDLDMHRFGYISRKGFSAFQDRLKYCTLDFRLTIQGTKAEELPECILCCLHMKEINYSNYNLRGL